MYINIYKAVLLRSFKNPLRIHDSISSAIPEFYTSHGIQTADITQRKENTLKFWEITNEALFQWMMSLKDFRISSVETVLQQTAFTFRLWIIVSAYGQEIWGPDIEAKNYSIWKLLGQELAFNRVLVNTTWEHITHNAFSQHLIYLTKASFKQCYTL